MRLSALILTALAARVSTARGSSIHNCCHLLRQELGAAVSYPGQSSYNSTETSYWSLQESEILPACIVHPSSTEDVARAVSIIGSVGSCKFAIKGQGHSPAAGFANVNHGVTIDMTPMASVKVKCDNSVAMIGAGASWLQVYRHLDPLGVSVTGGRNGLVGVGGLLLGGGISHFSPRRGWASNNVINFEVVLGNGSVVNANRTSHSDLYKALKGGGNNFGVVTRFDLATFPQGNISATSITNDISQREAVFNAFTDITAAPQFDMDTSLVTGLLYNSTSKLWKLTNSAVYAQPIPHPRVFNALFSIPSITNSTSITSVAAFADEKATPPLNWLFATATLRPSVRLMMDIFDALNATLGSVNPPGGVVWSIAFEPLAGAMLSGKKDNVLGIGQDDNGFIVLLSALWPVDASRDAVNEAAQKAMSLIETRASAESMLQKFQYMNYAAAYQTPVESYGDDNVEFLLRVSRHYDAERVFSERVQGGFKL